MNIQGRGGVGGRSPVSNGWLVPVPEAGDVGVEVRQTSCHGLGDVAELVPCHHVGLQIVGQRALWRRDAMR